MAPNREARRHPNPSVTGPGPVPPPDPKEIDFRLRMTKIEITRKQADKEQAATEIEMLENNVTELEAMLVAATGAVGTGKLIVPELV